MLSGGRQLTHRREREPWHVHPADVLQRSELSDHVLERVLRTHLVVAIGAEQECVRASDASAEKAEQIERGIVCPVHVLDHHHDRPTGRSQMRQHRVEEVDRRPIVHDDPGEHSPGVGREVVERAERARRGERIARTLDHVGRVGDGPANARTNEDLPAPASPATSTIEP